MKRILVAATLLMATNLAFAEEQVCRSIEGLAENAMQFRQANVPMNKAMELADAVAVEDEANQSLKGLTQQLITTAYKQPVQKDTAQQSAAVTGFGNAVYSSCMQESSR
jgi:uncharacterized protein YdeI (BOF family)